MGSFQMVGDKNLNRADHIWMESGEGMFKCVLCGGMTRVPPPCPTPEKWIPQSFEPLTGIERDLGRNKSK